MQSKPLFSPISPPSEVNDSMFPKDLIVECYSRFKVNKISIYLLNSELVLNPVLCALPRGLTREIGVWTFRSP